MSIWVCCMKAMGTLVTKEPPQMTGMSGRANLTWSMSSRTQGKLSSKVAMPSTSVPARISL